MGNQQETHPYPPGMDGANKQNQQEGSGMETENGATQGVDSSEKTARLIASTRLMMERITKARAARKANAERKRAESIKPLPSKKPFWDVDIVDQVGAITPDDLPKEGSSEDLKSAVDNSDDGDDKPIGTWKGKPLYRNDDSQPRYR